MYGTRFILPGVYLHALLPETGILSTVMLWRVPCLLDTSDVLLGPAALCLEFGLVDSCYLKCSGRNVDTVK